LSPLEHFAAELLVARANAMGGVSKTPPISSLASQGIDKNLANVGEGIRANKEEFEQNKMSRPPHKLNRVFASPIWIARCAVKAPALRLLANSRFLDEMCLPNHAPFVDGKQSAHKTLSCGTRVR